MAMLVTGALALTALPTASAVPQRPEPPRTAAAITAALNEDVTIPGTAWMTRPDGKILVSYDSTVSGAKLKSLTSTTQKFGSQIVLEKLPGKLTTKLSGGSPIHGGGYTCSLGFNVQRKGRYYFLTAGHCGLDAENWFQDENERIPVGWVHHASFPWNDYALVVYHKGIRPGGSVNLYNGKSQDIAKAVNPGLNQLVYRTGATTGLHSGRVTGLNATVNYQEGRVAGLIRTNVCVEAGDSGGPLFYRTFAFGLTSGGNGDCSSGGTTYFQPVVEALKVYGVSVY
ncbi:S1 family peptidase [Streptomyces sp. SID13031]|nr:S1 family peptidase [Streptomyces sp. SID13031]